MAEPGNETDIKTVNQPKYDNELSIFKKETKFKLKEFRQARSNWVASEDVTETLNQNVREGVYASDVYKGRFFVLRKIGFRTNRLRNHHRTLRPLNCYTLRRKISGNEDDEYFDDGKNDNVALNLGYKDDKPNAFKESVLDIESGISFKSEDLQKSSKESVVSEKEPKKPKNKSEKKDNVLRDKLKKKSLSKQAFENLKAARHGKRNLKPCTCDDGKELTVVIKGFCLCDKSNVNKLKIHKVCEEFERIKNPDVRNKPHLTDSLEVHKKRMATKSSINGIASEEVIVKPENKNVDFKIKETDKKEKKDENDSLITLFRSKFNKGSEMALTREQMEKIKEISEIKSKEQTQKKNELKILTPE